jgi:hypothetical protein
MGLAESEAPATTDSGVAPASVTITTEATPSEKSNRSSWRRAASSGSKPWAVAPLIDSVGKYSMSWLAPRAGEFSVDSANWWQELKREPFHTCINLPLSVLLLGFFVFYLLLVFVLAALLYAAAASDPAALTPESSWAACLQTSWQSLFTVGYGGYAPSSTAASVLTALLVFLSLVTDSIGIGILYQARGSARGDQPQIV